MNAITPRTQHPAYQASEAEHAQMARNRSGIAPTLRKLVAVDPLDADAFRVGRLHAAVIRARSAVDAAVLAGKRATSSADRNKARKAKQRALKGLRAAEASLAAETRGEPLAPAVQRMDVVTADGVVLREARVVVAGGRAEIKSALDRLRGRRCISDEEYAGGRRYRSAYDLAHRDQTPIGMGGEGIGGSPSSGNRRIENAIGAGAMLLSMRSRLTPAAVNLVETVVIHDLTVESWAARQRTPRGGVMSQEAAMGMLVLALGLLAACGDRRADVFDVICDTNA